ncbi:MAG: FHIPEP family type III secretion protein [Planctomycetes bacterium]|nr:FHIPEP family type III secretion protein [Planctomycetota bacterium]
MESTTLALQGSPNQTIYSMFFDSWRLLLFLGIAAGLINLLARRSNREALGISIPTAFFAYPIAFGLGILALFLVCLSLTTLPTFPLLVLAQLCLLMAWTSYQKTKIRNQTTPTAEVKPQTQTNKVVGRSIITIELGRSLLGLPSGDESRNVIDQIASLRAVIFEKIGLKIPSIQIKDNLKLPTNTYRISVRNGIVGEGVVYADRYMVIEDEKSRSVIEGIQEQDPVFGLPVLWITQELQEEVGGLFVQVMDPVSVIITHLSKLVEKHAAELLTRDETFSMVEELRISSPRLVDGVIGKTITLSRFHRILKALLEEKVSVKDLPLIIETAADTATLPIENSIEEIRGSLRRQICAIVSTPELDGQQVISCVKLPLRVETAIANGKLSKDQIANALHRAASTLVTDGLPIVVVTSSTNRRKVQARISSGKDEVIVLSKDEIVPEVSLNVVGTLELEVQSTSKSSQKLDTGDKMKTIAYARLALDQCSEQQVSQSSIALDLAEIKTLVGEVLSSEKAKRRSPHLVSVQKSLLSQGIDTKLASEIVQRLHADPSVCEEEIHASMMRELIARLPQSVPPPSRGLRKSTVIALVGPTGVGKTTTIAKLATKFRMQQGRSVSLITADTYRVAAVDQLQQYAELFDATLEIAGTAEQMQYAIDACRHTDIVLIDTAGRSASDCDRIQETASILEVASPDETHLVLSAATSMSASQRAASSFLVTGYDRIIVSKLDEVDMLGETISALCAIGRPLSWFTDGQDISSHINLARPRQLVDAAFQSQQPITL